MVKKQDPSICCHQEITLVLSVYTERERVKGWGKVFHAKRETKKRAE